MCTAVRAQYLVLCYPAAVAVMAPASAHCPRLPQPRSLISHLEEALHCALVEALVVVHIPRAAISRTLRTSRRLAKAKADAQPVMQHEPRLAVLEGVVVPMTQQGASGHVQGGPRGWAAWRVGCGRKLQYGFTLASIRSPHFR